MIRSFPRERSTIVVDMIAKPSAGIPMSRVVAVKIVTRSVANDTDAGEKIERKERQKKGEAEQPSQPFPPQRSTRALMPVI